MEKVREDDKDNNVARTLAYYDLMDCCTYCVMDFYPIDRVCTPIRHEI